MKIFTEQHIMFNVLANSISHAFQLIARRARELGIVDDENQLVEGLLRRESLSTTGMEGGFAIPHAMNANIKNPAVIAVKFAQGVEWGSVDHSLVRFAIVLLIPEKQLSTLHMDVLSRVATGLMDQNFKNTLLYALTPVPIFEAINNIVNVVEQPTRKVIYQQVQQVETPIEQTENVHYFKNNQSSAEEIDEALRNTRRVKKTTQVQYVQEPVEQVVQQPVQQTKKVQYVQEPVEQVVQQPVQQTKKVQYVQEPVEEVVQQPVQQTKKVQYVQQPIEPVEQESVVVTTKTTKKTKAKKQTKAAKKLTFVGVSACATGIAHTFMAQKALEIEGAKQDYVVQIETQGQNGAQNVLSDEIIEKADYVIIAADIYVDTERFANKKIFHCDTNKAINDPAGTFEEAIKTAKQGGYQISSDNINNKPKSFSTPKRGSRFQEVFMKHFLSGVSHMIPVLVFSGIIYAIINAIATGLYPDNVNNSAWMMDNATAMYYAMQVAGIGFTFFAAIMGANIAQSIGGRPAFAPGLIATFAAANPSMYYFYDGIPSSIDFMVGGEYVSISNVSLGIFAAILMGFSAGHLVKWVNGWKIKDIFRPVMSILFVPVFCTALIVFPFLFLFSGFLGCAMNYFAYYLSILGGTPGVNFAVGFILGAMIGFDMGGPVNKVAVSTGTCLILVDPRIMGACAAAIPVAPLACGLATMVFRNVFSKEERDMAGLSALSLGFMGISEGAIPMFSKYPKQTLIANVVGSAVAGGLAFLFCVGGHVAMWGGPLIAFCGGIYADPGQISVQIDNIFGGNQLEMIRYISVLWYFLAIASGVIVEVFLYAFLVGGYKRKMLWKETMLNKGVKA